MHVLALCMKAHQVSPLIFLSIADWKNKEADFESRTFKDRQGWYLSLNKFILLFNKIFKSKIPYTGVSLSSKIVSKLISEMQTKLSKIESWLCLTQKDLNIGLSESSIVGV